MQRLFAHAVAREKQRLLFLIPEREGELTAEPFDDAGPQARQPSMIASVSEAVAKEWPLALQLGAQFLVVKDLAVEGDRDAAVFGMHRLIARGEVDDGELTMPKREAGGGVEALTVGAAMGNGRRRAANEIRVEGPLTTRVVEASNAAHERPRFLARRQV